MVSTMPIKDASKRRQYSRDYYRRKRTELRMSMSEFVLCVIRVSIGVWHI